MPDGPGRFPQGSTCPAVLRNHWKEDCIFTYGAVTLYGRTFQTVQLTLSYPSFNLVGLRPSAGAAAYGPPLSTGSRPFSARAVHGPRFPFRKPAFHDRRPRRARLSTRLLWSCNPRLSFRIAWFRLFRFRSPLLSESRLFSLPPGTEMVHFPGFASCGYVFTA